MGYVCRLTRSSMKILFHISSPIRAKVRRGRGREWLDRNGLQAGLGSDDLFVCCFLFKCLGFFSSNNLLALHPFHPSPPFQMGY